MGVRAATWRAGFGVKCVLAYDRKDAHPCNGLSEQQGMAEHHKPLRFIFAFCLPFHMLPRYPAGMPVLIRTRQALVKCKVCGAQTPSLTRGVPVLPARVPCSVCGARQVYRPSEVFIGSLPQVWKGQALR